MAYQRTNIIETSAFGVSYRMPWLGERRFRSSMLSHMSVQVSLLDLSVTGMISARLLSLELTTQIIGTNAAQLFTTKIFSSPHLLFEEVPVLPFTEIKMSTEVLLRDQAQCNTHEATKLCANSIWDAI